MTHVIGPRCADERALYCIDACPVSCIIDGPGGVYVDEGECIDCGLCIDECPVSAIVPSDEAPASWKIWAQQVGARAADMSLHEGK